MPRLSKLLGGPKLFIKRDDCTGLATGGNKTRKLEFLIADALEKGADTVITQGATQSNHARQTAAAAARMGMRCVLLLEDRTGSRDPSYLHSGNVFLERLMGAPTRIYASGTDMRRRDARRRGRKCVQTVMETIRIIPGGGSTTPSGALGYVELCS